MRPQPHHTGFSYLQSQWLSHSEEHFICSAFDPSSPQVVQNIIILIFMLKHEFRSTGFTLAHVGLNIYSLMGETEVIYSDRESPTILNLRIFIRHVMQKLSWASITAVGKKWKSRISISIYHILGVSIISSAIISQIKHASTGGSFLKRLSEHKELWFSRSLSPPLCLRDLCLSERWLRSFLVACPRSDKRLQLRLIKQLGWNE